MPPFYITYENNTKDLLGHFIFMYPVNLYLRA